MVNKNSYKVIGLVGLAYCLPMAKAYILGCVLIQKLHDMQSHQEIGNYSERYECRSYL